eukprot:CAMPEP_0174240486 /NCGR_PEP_ID=MMETSP0417-20130205/19055_1 /TAXON_ID=242541 /ORGANISM="Mayorella sp, Strain BSH-02190019" /LENGTH=418 /DNA_ID=CAMNT_0015319583 /DNA_START=100 /DNA_END=1354 /DNA_ORIENTATION=+
MGTHFTLPKGVAPCDGDAALCALLEPIRARYDLPSFAAAIVTIGERADVCTRICAVGYRQRGAAKPAVTVNDRWHIGSNTKAMTATVAARLVERGLLSWDTRVSACFPKFACHAAASSITLRQLLTHQSGLAANLSVAQTARARASQSELRQQRRQLVARLLSSPPSESPGTYSNLGFVVAAAMLEEVANCSFRELLQRELFAPLGVQSAGFGQSNTAGRADQPVGHGADGAPALGAGADNVPLLDPAGRVHLTLADWGRFVGEHMLGRRARSDLLPASTFVFLHGECSDRGSGSGWIPLTREWAGGLALTHSGSNTLNYAVVWMAPERGVAFLVCTNQANEQTAKACDEVVVALLDLWKSNSDEHNDKNNKKQNRTTTTTTPSSEASQPCEINITTGGCLTKDLPLLQPVWIGSLVA